jgi:hypothetical protein
MLDIASQSISMLRSSGPAAPAALAQGKPTPGRPNVREAFDDFVGQTFFGQMLSSMRETVGKPAYFHGGRMEEAFQGQLDQLLSEKLSDASAEQFSNPMYELFTLHRPS